MPARRVARRLLVLHAPADEAFARGFLAPALGLRSEDGAAGLTISSQELARRPVLELARLIDESGTVLPVLSPAFLADPWLQLSDEQASHQALDGGAAVVPLLLHECEVPLHLRAAVALDFRRRDEWDDEVARLRAHLEQPATPPAALPCPYPGMQPYRAADAAFFHGREDDIAELLAQLDAGARELYVIGPSGSGKSSLIAAGVVPQLLARAGEGALLVRSMRPGAAPVAALINALMGARPDTPANPPADMPANTQTDPPADPRTDPPAGAPASEAEDRPRAPLLVEDALAGALMRAPAARLLLVIDQAEELFTLSSAEQRRQLARAVRLLRAEPRCTLIVTVRADFFAELLQCELWLESERRHHNLSPLSEDELRQAIELPARQLHVYLEPALLDRLLADAAGAPAALPLLQEALVYLWGRRRQRLLTLADYQALGGAGGNGLATALAHRADEVLGQLTSARAVIARRVLLRLVAFGEGRPNTRRQQTRAALGAGEPAAELDAVLDALAASRLVILDSGERGVPAAPPGEARAKVPPAPSDKPLLDLDLDLARVLDLDDDARARDLAAGEGAPARSSGGAAPRASARAARLRDDVRVDLCHDMLITAWPSFAGWIEARRADEQQRRQLHALATAWLARGRAGAAVLDEVELQAALARRKGEAARELGESPEVTELIAASQRVLEVVQRDKRRRLRTAVTALLLFTAASIYQTTSAVLQKQEAQRHQLEAEASEQYALRQRKKSEALLAAQYQETGRRLFLEEHPQQALLNLVAAREHGGEGPVLRMLFRAATRTSARFALAHGEPVSAAGYSDDGARLLTTGGGGSLRVWSAAGMPLSPPLLHPAAVERAALSPDGTQVVSSSADSIVRLWNVAADPPAPRLLPHPARVTSARWSPDGRLLATASEDGAVRLWDARSGARWLAPLWHPRPVRDVRFSPDGGSLVAVVEGASSVSLWTLAPVPHELELMDRKRPAFEVADARFDGSGDRLAVRYQRPSRVLLFTLRSPPVVDDELADDELADDEPDDAKPAVTAKVAAIAKPAVTAKVAAIAEPAVTAKVVAIPEPASTAKVAEIPEPASTAKVAEIPEPERMSFDEPIQQLELAGDPGTLIAIGTHDIALRADGSRRTLDAPSPLREVRVSRDGRRIAAQSIDQMIRIWDTRSGELLATIEPEHGTALAALSPDGAQLVTIDAQGVAVAWEISSTRPDAPSELLAIGPQGRDGVFSPDNRWIVTAAAEGLTLWDASTGARKLSYALPRGHSPWRLSFSPTGRYFANLSLEGAVSLCELETQRCASLSAGGAVPEVIGHQSVRPMAFSPDGRYLAAAISAEQVQLWEVRGPDKIAQLQHGPAASESPGASGASGTSGASGASGAGELTSLSFASDGRRLLTGSSNGTAKLWDLTTFQPIGPALRHPSGGAITSAQIGPDGTRLVTADASGTAYLWDAATLQRLAQLAQGAHVTEARFSPDGARIATHGDDALVNLWDATSGRRLHSLEHAEQVAELAFSPDGTRLVTVAEQARLWEVETGQPLTPWLRHGSLAAAVDTPAARGARDEASARGDAGSPIVQRAPSSKRTAEVTRQRARIYRAAFSPDGERLLTIGLDETARLWDIGLDRRSLDEWRQLARRSASPRR